MGLKELIKETRSKEFQYSGKYKFEGSSFHVKSNSDNLIQVLNHYFKEWIYTGDPEIHLFAQHDKSLTFDYQFQDYQEVGKKRIKEQYYDEEGVRLVKKTKTGVHFGIAEKDWYAFGDLESYPNQLINFINAIFMENNLPENAMLFHAAGVAKNDKGIVIAAKSGKGKSTTALNLLNQGLDFVSNDRVILQKTNNSFKMIGVPKHPRVNPGTLLNNSRVKHLLKNPERFDSMSQQEIWDFEEKYDVLVDEIYGQDIFNLIADSIGLLIIDWGDSDDELSLNPLNLAERPDLLPAIMKTPSLMTPRVFEEMKDASEQDYITFLEGLPLFILEGKIDTEKGLKLIQEKFF